MSLSDSSTTSDPAVDAWLDFLEPIPGGGLPDTYRIWTEGRRYLEAGEFEKAAKCQTLIKLLHDSYVPIRLDVGEGTTFAYGGIGIIIHPAAELGAGLVIGSNVTIGGKNKPSRMSQKAGTRVTVPKIGDFTNIASGAKVLGGTEVGAFSVIGVNAVVMNHLPLGSVAVGSPAKVIGQITTENALAKRGNFPALSAISDEEFMNVFQGRVNASKTKPDA